MAKIARDESFVRDGKPLDFWLRELVCEDSDRRLAAIAAIQSMQHALPSIHATLRDVDLSDFDFKEHKGRLVHAMGEAIRSPDFDTADFVRRLCALELAKDEEWQRHCEANQAIRQVRDAKFERLSQPLIETINTSSDELEKTEATTRFAHLCRAYICGGRQKRDKVSPSLFSGGVARILAFEALGSEIMSAPEAIEGLLAIRGLRYQGLRALKGAGPAAVSFAPMLLATIDSALDVKKPLSPFSFGEDASALAAIGRGNLQAVDALIERLSSSHVTIQSSAAYALELMAPELCGRAPTIVSALRPLLDSDQTSYAALRGLAAVGRDNAEIRKLVISRARPAPARMVSSPDFPEYKSDAAMTGRGVAIGAMKYFAAYAAECLPVLIDALDTFEEFDPDEQYGGPCGRISRVIAAYGSQAGPAAVPLAKHLSDSPGESADTILDALTAIGPAAADAIPLLEAYRIKRDGAEPPDDEDPVRRTLRVLKGEEPAPRQASW
jgi:hypothetical protein